MKKIFLIIIFYFNFINLYGLEVKCKFEEVYSNSQTQQGFLLLKGKKLRYEYLDKNLFTIIHFDTDFFLIQNNNVNNPQPIVENLELLNEIIELSESYPNIPDNYQKPNFKISIKKSLSNNFITRLSIQSNKLNLSIYFNDCKFEPINNLFFKHQPFFEYKYK